MEKKDIRKLRRIHILDVELIQFIYKYGDDIKLKVNKDIINNDFILYECQMTDTEYMQFRKKERSIRITKNKYFTSINTDKEFIELLNKWVEDNWNEYYADAREVWDMLCRLKKGKDDQ